MDCNTLKIHLLLQILFWKHIIDADKHNTFTLKNFKCTDIDPTFINFYFCRLNAINRSLTTLTMRASLLKSPVKSASFRFKIFKNSNGYKPFLIDVTFNFCALLMGRNIPMFTPFYDIMKPYSNLNTTCPFPETIIVQNLPINPDLVPSTWPSGEYRVDCSLITSRVVRSLVNVYVTVTEKIIDNTANKSKKHN